MLFQDKYDRAREYQKKQMGEQHPEYEEYTGEKLYEPTVSEQMEKGDMWAMIVAGWITIMPIAIVLLLIIVGISYLFFVR